MKKQKGIIISVVVATVFLVIGIAGIILKPKTKSININTKEIIKIDMRRHISKSQIEDKAEIKQIVDYLSRIKIREYHPYIRYFEAKNHGSKNAITIKLYNDKNSMEYKTISILSNDNLEIDGKLYSIVKNDDKIYDQLRNLVVNKNFCLPEISKDDIKNIVKKGFDQYSDEECLELYNKLIASNQIQKSQYQESDKYILINLIWNDVIRINILDNKYYISFSSKKMTYYFES